MAAYKLSKNGWVMPFFVIFSLAREKLLVTVAFDHPVLVSADSAVFFLVAALFHSIFQDIKIKLGPSTSTMISFLGPGSCAKEGTRSLEEEMAPDCLLN